ncbi:AMP-dependent synthetase and ligase [Sulfitobacter noctilucicola]|uniref:Long-chain acyl-CoA synthetase n=2 Tax=Sulfitobacter noctilucicola TaxID=1342301 RepID=A0A7W6M5W0_9RHOB|nr:AMP-binding protein [Sulfitobacter noctilucicola]KIN62414.1 AMP-dependent synthetase and ligase [Sulfitobacter noctilucicola]MBB4173053.1 long-chain acyl-CoA synthetase [Sulfitobacter noctilucicola]
MLFTGGLEVERGDSGLAGFQDIKSDPVTGMLAHLGTAIQSNAPFCVHSGGLPQLEMIEAGQFVTLTGGTSGRPKALRRSQASWIASFEQNAALFEYSTSDSIAVLGSLSHSLALYGVLEALHLGMDAHVLAGLSASDQMRQIDGAGISVLYATPTQLRLLSLSAQPTLSNVRLILCGGGMLDAATEASIRTLCPNAALRVFYGAAETSFITLSDAQTPQGAVGKAYPGVTLRVTDEQGRDSTGTGEVWVQSPYLFDGYAHGESTDTSWRGGFLSVGEFGTLDEYGTLWLKGRKGRMVTVADQTVFLEELESFIATEIPGRMTVVLAEPDRMRGQRLVAVVMGGEDAEIQKKIRTACTKTFGPMIAPKTVLFHPALPLLASGKPDLSALERWIATR